MARPLTTSSPSGRCRGGQEREPPASERGHRDDGRQRPRRASRPSRRSAPAPRQRWRWATTAPAHVPAAPASRERPRATQHEREMIWGRVPGLCAPDALGFGATHASGDLEDGCRARDAGRKQKAAQREWRAAWEATQKPEEQHRLEDQGAQLARAQQRVLGDQQRQQRRPAERAPAGRRSRCAASAGESGVARAWTSTASQPSMSTSPRRRHGESARPAVARTSRTAAPPRSAADRAPDARRGRRPEQVPRGRAGRCGAAAPRTRAPGRSRPGCPATRSS